MRTSDELLTLCRYHLDPQAERIAPRRNESAVLRAATAAGEVIVKAHRTRERFEQEVHAYRTWAPQLTDRTPRLLIAVTEARTLIMTALDGRPLNECRLTAEQEQHAYTQAGALLRAWHNTEQPRYTVDITGWLADRGDQWLHLAEPILPAARRREIRAHLRDLAALGSLPVTPCHLDFTPHNLLRGGDATIRLLDFEHARFDLPARDLVRFATRYWPSRPDLESAFFDAYGPLTDLDRRIIEHCSHLDALTAAVRATGRTLPPAQPNRQLTARRTR